jgi:hypothetical protein
VRELLVREPRLRWPVPADLPRRLQGQLIESVERRAKYLLFHTDEGTPRANTTISTSCSGRVTACAITTPAGSVVSCGWNRESDIHCSATWVPNPCQRISTVNSCTAAPGGARDR